MLSGQRTLYMALLIFIFFSSLSFANTFNNNSTHSAQDEPQQAALPSIEPQDSLLRGETDKYKPRFPAEANCRYISRIHILSENEKLTRRLLGDITLRAENKCLGAEDLRLLTITLQNELIAQGYITSIIDIPSQSLSDGLLEINLSYGHIDDLVRIEPLHLLTYNIARSIKPGANRSHRAEFIYGSKGRR